jgi:chloramphenicol O-acetyltransferase type A
MKTYLDIKDWPRAEHFEFFRTFEEPFFGVTVEIDCTTAYRKAKDSGVSFFISYLHKTMRAVNGHESFRYRIEGDKVAIYSRVDASATISRNDGSFGFSLIEYDPDFEKFSKATLEETQRVRNTPGLFTRTFESDNLIHFSAVPWIAFTSLSHARMLKSADSCPKISFGKMTVSASGHRTIPMSVHVHHALIDGLHLGQFIDSFQQYMLE